MKIVIGVTFTEYTDLIRMGEYFKPEAGIVVYEKALQSASYFLIRLDIFNYDRVYFFLKKEGRILSLLDMENNFRNNQPVTTKSKTWTHLGAEIPDDLYDLLQRYGMQYTQNKEIQIKVAMYTAINLFKEVVSHVEDGWSLVKLQNSKFTKSSIESFFEKPRRKAILTIIK